MGIDTKCIVITKKGVPIQTGSGRVILDEEMYLGMSEKFIISWDSTSIIFTDDMGYVYMLPYNEAFLQELSERKYKQTMAYLPSKAVPENITFDWN